MHSGGGGGNYQLYGALVVTRSPMGRSSGGAPPPPQYPPAPRPQYPPSLRNLLLGCLHTPALHNKRALCQSLSSRRPKAVEERGGYVWAANLLVGWTNESIKMFYSVGPALVISGVDGKTGFDSHRAHSFSLLYFQFD